MCDDIINILNLNYSDVQSCSSEKNDNSITYFITLIRKDDARIKTVQVKWKKSTSFGTMS